MKYDYETTTNSGVKYGFVVEGNKVDVYVNDKRWGAPQGERFIIALLNDIKNLKNSNK